MEDRACCLPPQEALSVVNGLGGLWGFVFLRDWAPQTSSSVVKKRDIEKEREAKTLLGREREEGPKGSVEHIYYTSLDYTYSSHIFFYTIDRTAYCFVEFF